MSETPQQQEKTKGTSEPNEAPNVAVVPSTENVPVRKRYKRFFARQEIDLELEDGKVIPYTLQDCDGDQRATILQHLASLAKIDPTTGKQIGIRDMKGSDEIILSNILRDGNGKLVSVEQIKALKLPGRVLAEMVEDGMKICGLDNKAADTAKKD